jgi:hypothetical protein
LPDILDAHIGQFEFDDGIEQWSRQHRRISDRIKPYGEEYDPFITVE